MSLKQQAFKGIKWTTLGSGAVVFFQILTVFILARLLQKEDFGLFATVTVVLGLARYFVDAGLGAAVIHKQKITEEDLGTAYFINVMQGWLVFLAVFLSSGFIADFYEEAALEGLIKSGSLVFLFQPFGRQYGALFQKDLKFKLLAIVDLSTALLGLVIAVSTALHGYGALSFILGQLSAVFVRTMLLLSFGIKEYGFNWGFSRKSATFFFRFGAIQIGDNLVNYFNSQVDTLLIGKVLGQAELGIFFVAKQIVVQPLSLISPIVNRLTLPILAKLQKDPSRMKTVYVRTIHSLAFVLILIFYLFVIFSEEIVEIALGRQWSEAIPIVSILALYALQRGLGSPVGNLILASGRVELGLYWNLMVLFYMPAIIFLSANWGLMGVAWSLPLGFLGLQIPGWYFLTNRLVSVSMIDYFKPILKLLFKGTILFFPVFFIDVGPAKYVVALFSILFYVLSNLEFIRFLLAAKTE